jgi:hypothetical protein
LANYQNFMTETMVNAQLTFGFEHPLLTLLTGGKKSDNYIYTRDPNQMRATPESVGRESFHGKKVTVPLQLNEVSSGSFAEGGVFEAGGVRASDRDPG